MKLKLTATIKKEALLPGMEMAIQDVDLQKELNKPGIVQQVNESDQALKQLQAKYSSRGNWDGANLKKDLKSFMEKFHPNTPYGIGEEVYLGDLMFQRDMAIYDARLDLARNFGPDKNKNVTNVTQTGVAGRVFFTNVDETVYVLAY